MREIASIIEEERQKEKGNVNLICILLNDLLNEITRFYVSFFKKLFMFHAQI